MASIKNKKKQKNKQRISKAPTGAESAAEADWAVRTTPARTVESSETARQIWEYQILNNLTHICKQNTHRWHSDTYQIHAHTQTFINRYAHAQSHNTI